MASEDGKESLVKDVGKKETIEIKSYESISSEEDGKVRLIEENSGLFGFFKVFGLGVIHYDKKNKKYRMSQGSFLIVRMFWSLFHLIAVLFGMFLKKMTMGPNFIYDHTLNAYLVASIYILVFIIVDPIQTTVLRRCLEYLPDLLNNEVKALENNKISRNASMKIRLCIWGENKEINQAKKKSNVEDGDDPNPESVSKWNCMYNWEPKITITLLVVTALSLFMYGFWLEARWKAIPNEAVLIVMCFFLVFPMLSTWFCVVFIKYKYQLYKIIETHITDEDFEYAGIIEDGKIKDEPKINIKDISEYLEKMQVIFKKISDTFFKFVFGMNSFIFVVCSVFCMFELLESFDNARKFVRDFDEIFYAIPFAACMFHILVICKSSHSLIAGQHEKLRMRLKCLMTSLMMDGKDMKKIELLYKNLKDWPPQAEIYGGYKINYQIFIAMLLFTIGYARIFKTILKDYPTNSTESIMSTTMSTVV